MSWFNAKGTWAKVIQVEGKPAVSRSSRVKASSKDVKWKDEKKSIKTNAEKALYQRLANEGILIRKDRDITFSEVCTVYKQNHNFDKYRIKRIADEFGSKPVNKISVLDIRKYHNRILLTCAKPTWNRHRNDLSAIFNTALEMGCISQNPVKGIKKYPERKIQEYLSQEHADALLAEARKDSFYLYAIVYTALYTGKRQAEILDLEWSDVDFNNHTIRFLIRKKVGGKEEQVLLPPIFVFQVLAEQKRCHPEKPFPSFPRRAWRRIRDKVDEDIGLPDRRFHGLRHRCATKMIENGATLYDVQYYLGHSSSTTTEMYAHISKERDVKIRSFLE